MKKIIIVLGCCLTLSVFLEHFFNIYQRVAIQGPDAPIPRWFGYTSELVSYLVEAIPAFVAGLILGRSGFALGAMVGGASDLLQKALYFMHQHPPITWFTTSVVVSTVFTHCVIGAIAGAAGQLAAQNISNQSFKRTR